MTANLAAWRENKTPLVELLRRHPNRNEQELVVVFDFAESREIDHNSVDENKFEMIMLAHDAGLDDIKLSDFQAALDAATADYATVPEVSWLETIRTRGHIKCAEGQKASRIINRLCFEFKGRSYSIYKKYKTRKTADVGKDFAPRFSWFSFFSAISMWNRLRQICIHCSQPS